MKRGGNASAVLHGLCRNRGNYRTEYHRTGSEISYESSSFLILPKSPCRRTLGHEGTLGDVQTALTLPLKERDTSPTTSHLKDLSVLDSAGMVNMGIGRRAPLRFEVKRVRPGTADCQSHARPLARRVLFLHSYNYTLLGTTLIAEGRKIVWPNLARASKLTLSISTPPKIAIWNRRPLWLASFGTDTLVASQM